MVWKDDESMNSRGDKSQSGGQMEDAMDALIMQVHGNENHVKGFRNGMTKLLLSRVLLSRKYLSVPVECTPSVTLW